MTKPQQTVMVFIFNDNKLLLSRRLNTWFGNNQFSVPGGNVDDSETPAEAALRETNEETNLALSLDDLQLFYTSNSTAKGRAFENYYYATNTFSGDLKNNEPHRHSELDWYPSNSLPNDTMPLIVELLKKYEPA